MRNFALLLTVFVLFILTGCIDSSTPERPVPAQSDRAAPDPGEEPETMEDMR